MTRFRFTVILLVTLMALVMVPVYTVASTSEAAVTVKETIVRSAPGSQSAQVAVLPVDESVALQTRQGGWYQIVFRNEQSGWLPLLSIRKVGMTANAKPEKSSGLRSVLSAYRTGSSGVTVATGVRGLDAVDLEKSQPDMVELQRIDNFLCTDQEAKTYASQSGLTSRNITWLPAPGEVQQ